MEVAHGAWLPGTDATTFDATTFDARSEYKKIWSNVFTTDVAPEDLSWNKLLSAMDAGFKDPMYQNLYKGMSKEEKRSLRSPPKPFVQFVDDTLGMMPDALDCVTKAYPVYMEEKKNGGKCWFGPNFDLGKMSEGDELCLTECFNVLEAADPSCAAVTGQLAALFGSGGPFDEVMDDPEVMKSLKRVARLDPNILKSRKTKLNDAFSFLLGDQEVQPAAAEDAKKSPPRSAGSDAVSTRAPAHDSVSDRAKVLKDLRDPSRLKSRTAGKQKMKDRIEEKKSGNSPSVLMGGTAWVFALLILVH